MARDHARLLVSIWDDDDFKALSAADQWTFFALLSSPDLSWCGLMPLLPSRLARLSRDGTPIKAARSLDRLADARFVLLDRDTDEVAVRSFVRHDGVMKQPNVLCAALKAWGRVQSEPIRDGLRKEFTRAYSEGFPKGFGEGFGKAFARSFPQGVPIFEELV